MRKKNAMSGPKENVQINKLFMQEQCRMSTKKDKQKFGQEILDEMCGQMVHGIGKCLQASLVHSSAISQGIKINNSST